MSIGLSHGAAPSRRLASSLAGYELDSCGVGAWVVLLLGLTAARLKEPTQEPPETTDPSEATQEDGGDTESGKSGAEVLDVSEFSTQPQESAGYPDMVTEFPEDGDQLLLDEVRVGEHEGYDRIVFEHAGEGAPGWQAEYVDEALEPGSGFPVEVQGQVTLYLSTVGLVPENAVI